MKHCRATNSSPRAEPSLSYRLKRRHRRLQNGVSQIVRDSPELPVLSEPGLLVTADGAARVTAACGQVYSLVSRLPNGIKFSNDAIPAML